MRVAIASQNASGEGDICLQAGRAPFYLIYENGKLIEPIKNPFAIGGGGAGFGVAKMLSDKEVNLIVAGQFGPNMIAGLRERGVEYKESQENIMDFLKNNI